jgi:hypothetical protein
MMGAGMLLRTLVGSDRLWAGVLGAVYVGVGTALFLADRAFWHALLRPETRPQEGPQNEQR